MKALLKFLVACSAICALPMVSSECAFAQYMGESSHDSKVVPILTTPTQANSKVNTDFTSYTAEPTVRSMVLSPFETIMNVGSNGGEIISIIWGSLLLVSGARRFGTKGANRTLAFGGLAIVLGLCTPLCFSWLSYVLQGNESVVLGLFPLRF